MREIKFRAWINNGQYSYMAIQGEPDLETLGSFMHHYSDCELQQFTGLKDKNGKDIYEGDILHKKIELKGGIEGNWIVFYGEGGFDIKNIDRTVGVRTMYLKKYWKHSYEVIGNIHENPELLVK